MNEVTCNGIPKSGTHILLKLADSLGYKFGEAKGTRKAYHRHDSTGKDIKGSHLYIKRDPRNVLVSWVRYINKNPNEPQELIKAIKSFWGDRPLKEVLKSFQWLLRPSEGHLILTFEDILTDGGVEVQRAIKFLDEPHNYKEVYNSLWGGTPTFTGEHSQWEKYWTDKVDYIWESEGLIELEESYGYAKSL